MMRERFQALNPKFPNTGMGSGKW